ncbi:hypothetical protein C7H19_00425 [Aphanothece hegewaldii CCALA 016]|uniref:Lipid-A-disaccharide synthase n=1 Tax=Aphanothece hegewaldii CCALA 016 TaxID=2107694 RepID=A0A2T1M371_9CHRO|nr:lipid-A-disaccharide synthase-related protein [Aphanothece hegewaldii]PSF39287.1 hypothetical protein C7H19_00425 [Aphanothece hegewaldii CCALA 016]
MSSSKRILFISNGHGEDNHSSHVIQTLRELSPNLEIAAMPIVGEGKAYRALDIPIIGPTQNLPSGGFTYMNRLRMIKDIQAGIIGLTWKQLQAVQRYAPSCDLVMATGDTVGQSFAYLSGRPYVSFISCLSSLYEGRLQLELVLSYCLRSSKCLTIFTRDAYTAEDLQKQGFKKAKFGGIPSLDRLIPTRKDLQLLPDVPMIALFPGSRLPEAERNFSLQLQLVLEIAKVMGQQPVAFRAALVSSLMSQLGEIASSLGWQHDNGKLTYTDEKGSIVAEVLCYCDAFNDIVNYCTLVIGMAGLAVDQAVAIGKPIVQIAGEGPQFTYAFAEAQTRLLGCSVQTVGTKAADAEILKEAAQVVSKTLYNKDYFEACLENGSRRFGPLGASYRIANELLTYLGERPNQAINLDLLTDKSR